MKNGKTTPSIDESKEDSEIKLNKKYFSKYDGYILKTWNKDKREWLKLYTTCDMVGNSRSTWNLNEIKDIFKTKKAYGQVITGVCGYHPVWQTCGPTIDNIALEHDKKLYYLSKLNVTYS